MGPRYGLLLHPGPKGKGTLDQAGLRGGGVHTGPGRTCSLQPHSEPANHAPAFHSKEGPGNCAENCLSTVEGAGSGRTVRVTVLNSRESSIRTQTRPCPLAEPSLPRPSFALLAWEPAAEKARTQSWPCWGPRGGEKNAAAWWPLGPWGNAACP